MNTPRFGLILLAAFLSCSSLAHATIYGRWNFNEPAGTSLTATINSGTLAGSWTSDITNGEGIFVDGSGALKVRTNGDLDTTQSFWVSPIAPITTGTVYVTVKFKKFVLAETAGSVAEIFRLSTNNLNAGKYAQAMIQVDRKLTGNYLQVRGYSSTNSTSSSGAYSSYVNLGTGFSAPDGLTLCLAVNYTTRQYVVSAKVGNNPWQENLGTGTVYTGASFTGIRIKAGNDFTNVGDEVLIDQVTISDVKPEEEHGTVILISANRPAVSAPAPSPRG